MFTHSRARRKKCDETRPACKGCVERNQACLYPGSRRFGPPKPVSMISFVLKRCRLYLTVYQPVLARKTVPSQDTLDVSRPSVALFENEKFLIQHFCEALTRLLSFRSHSSSNAFCTHLLPLAESSSLVLGAVETISTAHLHMLGSKPFSDAGDLHSKSLRSLSIHLSSSCIDGASGEIALTATLLLVYYEVRFH
jgi:hypothetical protein